MPFAEDFNDARSEFDEDTRGSNENIQVPGDAVLEGMLESAITVMPRLREALEPVQQVSANALEGELRRALGNYQLKLGLAVGLLKDLAIENQMMKTALRKAGGRSATNLNIPVQIEAHRETIKAAAQKYLFWFGPFPTPAIFSRIRSPRPPQVDVFDPRRARDETLNQQAEVVEVFSCFPSNHPVLQYFNAKTASMIGKMFITEVNTERSHYVGRVLENLASLAPTQGWPAITNYRDRELVKNNATAQILRGANDDNFPPFAFPPGTSIDNAELAYTGDIFPLVIRMGLYGPSSLTSSKDARSKGVSFDLQGITPGMFALSATVLRHALSGADAFSHTSKNVPHTAYFNRIKLQVFLQYWDTPAMVVRRARATNVILGTDQMHTGDDVAETHGALATDQRNAALAAGFAGTIPTSTPAAPAPTPSPAPAATTAHGPPASSPSNSQPLTYIDAPSSRSNRSATAPSSASRRRAPSPISAGLALPEILKPAEELEEHVATLTLRDGLVDEDINEPEQPPAAPAKRAKGRQTTKAAAAAPEVAGRPKTRSTARARK